MPAEKLQLVRSAYANETAEKKRTLYARSYHVWCKLSKLPTFEQPIKLFPIYRYIHALMQSLLSTVNVVIYGRQVSHGVTLVVKASDFSTEKPRRPRARCGSISASRRGRYTIMTTAQMVHF